MPRAAAAAAKMLHSMQMAIDAAAALTPDADAAILYAGHSLSAFTIFAEYARLRRVLPPSLLSSLFRHAEGAMPPLSRDIPCYAALLTLPIADAESLMMMS